MSPIEFQKNGAPWQDQLEVGDEVFVDVRTANPEEGTYSISTYRTEISAVGGSTLRTLDGEIFDKASRKAVDFARAGHGIELIPILLEGDQVVAVLPTFEALRSEGMSEEEAQAFLDLHKPDEEDNN